MANKKYRTVSEFFIKHPDRWVRGVYEDGHGNHCLLGALEKIYEHNLDEHENALNRLETLTECRPIRYNDEKAKDVIDIISLCLAADV